MRAVLWDNWKHLRVPFQLTLMPIFLWGYFLARPWPDGRFWQALVALHFCLYTGITAYNSYHDRDEGPIGGLEHPPLLHPSLLPLSLGLQGVGLLLALPVGATFTAIYLIFVVLGVLYSHPRTRWKASPVLSTLVVFGGQGGLGFLAGWAAARGELSSVVDVMGAVGGLAAALTTLGMYPLTQVYQGEEDARRGDRTLRVMLGAEGSLRLAQGALLLAGVSAIVVVLQRLTWMDTVVLAVAYGGLVWQVERLRQRFARLSRSEAFRLVRRLSYGASLAFAAFICLRLVHWP